MLFCMGADITRSQCAYVDTDYIYNFRDELTKHYEGIENPPLLIEEVSKTQSKNGTIQQEYEAHIYLTLYIPHESKLRNK